MKPAGMSSSCTCNASHGGTGRQTREPGPSRRGSRGARTRWGAASAAAAGSSKSSGSTTACRACWSLASSSRLSDRTESRSCSSLKRKDRPDEGQGWRSGAELAQPPTELGGARRTHILACRSAASRASSLSSYRLRQRASCCLASSVSRESSTCCSLPGRGQRAIQLRPSARSSCRPQAAGPRGKGGDALQVVQLDLEARARRCCHDRKARELEEARGEEPGAGRGRRERPIGAAWLALAAGGSAAARTARASSPARAGCT